MRRWTVDPMQQRRRDMMGAAWQKKQADRMRQERDQFNRQQAETEQRVRNQNEGRTPAKPFGDDAWRPQATLTTDRPPSEPIGSLDTGPGFFRRTIGAILLVLGIVAVGIGIWIVYEMVQYDDSELIVVAMVYGGIGAVLLLARRWLLAGSRGGGLGIRSRGGGVSGEARSVQRRMESGGNQNVELLSFRVERYDPGGNRLNPVVVEMRGPQIRGSLQEGDEVRVVGRAKRGRGIKARKVKNLTTRSVVKVKRNFPFGLIGFVGIAALIVWFITSID